MIISHPYNYHKPSILFPYCVVCEVYAHFLRTEQRSPAFVHVGGVLALPLDEFGLPLEFACVEEGLFGLRVARPLPG